MKVRAGLFWTEEQEERRQTQEAQGTHSVSSVSEQAGQRQPEARAMVGLHTRAVLNASFLTFLWPDCQEGGLCQVEELSLRQLIYIP